MAVKNVKAPLRVAHHTQTSGLGNRCGDTLCHKAEPRSNPGRTSVKQGPSGDKGKGRRGREGKAKGKGKGERGNGRTTTEVKCVYNTRFESGLFFRCTWWKCARKYCETSWNSFGRSAKEVILPAAVRSFRLLVHVSSVATV
jgi:hypothetical protein